MNEIKVTVSYEKPTTTKFDALMEEYKAAKQIADETVSYYKPLADAAEEAKMDAILEQIEPIIEYAKQLSAMKKDKVTLNAYVNSSKSGHYGLQTFGITYHPCWDAAAITWNSMVFNKQRLKEYPEYIARSPYNILGNWDKWNMYKGLENDAIRQLKNEIEKQHQRGQKQINRLNNIQKEV